VVGIFFGPISNVRNATAKIIAVGERIVGRDVVNIKVSSPEIQFNASNILRSELIVKIWVCVVPVRKSVVGIKCNVE
jgi:hypothetical protein